MKLPVSVTLLALILWPISASSHSLSPVSAIGFQNASDGYDIDGYRCGVEIDQVDLTTLVASRDGSWAPEVQGCIYFANFATGTSTHWLDALSLRFELPEVNEARGYTLRAFVRKGESEEFSGSYASWHQYRLYQGAFSMTDADCDSPCSSSYADIPADRSWAGWIELPIPTEWAEKSSIEVTLRMWNIQVDTVELAIEGVTPSVKQSWGVLKQRYR